MILGSVDCPMYKTDPTKHMSSSNQNGSGIVIWWHTQQEHGEMQSSNDLTDITRNTRQEWIRFYDYQDTADMWKDEIWLQDTLK